MVKYIKSAESDYIKIGNKIYPTDASDYGYADADYIARDTQRKYDKEKADEAERAEKARLAKVGKELYDKALKALEGVDDVAEEDTNILDKLSETLVPRSGKCDTLAGEIVRAMERILYRYFNDGDRFFSGYGLETCGGSAEFLADNTDNAIRNTILGIADKDLDDNAYYKAIISLSNDLVVPYVLNHPELFGMPTEDSREYEPTEIENHIPLYDFDFWVESDVIRDMFDDGVIDSDDVYNWLDDYIRWNLSSGEIDSRYRLDGLDSIEIVNLTEDDYRTVKSDYHHWIADWEAGLLEEHPEYDPENDEYYDED